MSGKTPMSEAMTEVRKDLDERYAVASEILRHLENALRVYQVRTNSKKPDVDLPRCSKGHLDHLVKDLGRYVEEVHRIRCELPRLLRNGAEL